ncbi:MAG: ABC transporter permease [Huintestinicola sp.]
MSRLKKFNIILAAVNAVLLIAAGLLTGKTVSLKNEFSSDSAKQAWDGEKYSYAQISMFLPAENAIDGLGVFSLRQSVEEKLKEASVSTAKDNPEGRLWIDCASGESSLSMTGKLGNSQVRVTGTYGDYFIFHPEKLMCGSYYTGDDINIDRVILDRECSWQLFGSMDTAGMPVNIGNKVYYVAGVVESPDSKADKAAYGNTPRAYMPYESLKSLDESTALTAYEACLPNVVKDYAYTVIKDISPAGENAMVIDQSGRFGLIKLIKGRTEISESVMIKANMALPWYENRLRSAELTARLAAAPLPYLMIIPAVSLVYALFMLTKLLGRGVRAIKDKAEEKYQKKISEIYYKKRDQK